MFDATLTGGTSSNTGIDLTSNTIINAGNITVNNGAGPAIINLPAQTTVPTLIPNHAENYTGTGWSSDTLHIV